MDIRPGAEFDPGELRRQFPSLESGLYFNHAAMAPWPACSAEAVKRFAEENKQLGPSRYAEWIALEHKLREALARLTGASSAGDIALLKNTTEGISTVAWGLDWKPGENVVLPRDEFASNRLPWLAQRAQGVEVREVDIRAAEHAETALTQAIDRRTRIMAVSSVQWSDGFRLDLKTLGNACRDRGILFFVDAIQELGALSLDVSSCHISFLAADAHKWMLGPEGIAVFYSQEDARAQLILHQQGWHMFENPWSFARRDWTPPASARRFEAGSPNSMGQAALKASLDLLLETGMDRVEARIRSNTDLMFEHVLSVPELELVSRPELARRSGIVSFRTKGKDARSIQRQLAKLRVSCAVRDNAVRLSPHYYQGKQEIDEVFALIRQVIRERDG